MTDVMLSIGLLWLLLFPRSFGAEWRELSIKFMEGVARYDTKRSIGETND